MFNATFIVPTWKYFANPFKLQPLLELYYATILQESSEVDVSVTDLRNYRSCRNDNPGLSFEDFCDATISQKSLYLYWSPKTADFYEVNDVVTFLRRKYPQSLHVAGGTHVDNFTLECCDVFDAVIAGPGERAIPQIIKDCTNNSLKQVYRDNWKDVHYKDYPFARRDFLPKETIVNTELFEKYGSTTGTSVLFSKGCPFKCSFCVYNVPNRLQVRNPSDIEAEINYLKNDYGVASINLRDEVCLGLSEKTYAPVLHAIGNCNVTWRGQTRVGVKRDLLELAKKSGCVELALGVETVSEDVLETIQKHQTMKDSEDMIRHCKEVGIKTRINLILGLPNEPVDIVDKTIKFIDSNEPDYVSISGLCPVPGSDMFKNPSKYGIRMIDQDWNKHAHLMFRFNDNEDHGLPFEYEDGFTRSEIVQNILFLQKYLQERNMVY